MSLVADPVPRSQPRRSPAAVAELLSVEPLQPALSAREWVLAGKRRGRDVHALLLAGGRGEVQVKGELLALAGPVLLWLPPGEAELLRVDAAGSGFLLTASDDLLMRCLGAQDGEASLRHLAARVLLLEAERLTAELPLLPAAFEALRQELRMLEPGAMVAVEARFTLLLLLFWRRSGIALEAAGERGAGPQAFERFAHLVELHYREHWRIGTYARALGLTADHLHALCVRQTGAGPLALLHRRLGEEACRRLEQTGEPVEQIAYSLGFRDAAYFNRFFRRIVGAAPGSWRRARQDAAACAAANYAAWP